MANWKERGEVPDSEDEDDFDLESDNSPRKSSSNGGQRNDQRIDEIHDGDEGEGENERHSANERAHTTPERISLPRNVAAYEQSSPGTPRVFRTFDLSDIEDDQADECFPQETKDPDGVQVALPLNDEISRSYVRITSPTTSSLSSLADNEDAGISAGVPLEESRRSPIVEITPSQHARMQRDEFVGSRARRSFRQRNPIQLHPYMLEQEKYRQTLKARGIAPMRITETQDETQPESAEGTSQDPESQEMSFETGESQDMEFDWDGPSSSLARKSPEKQKEELVSNKSPAVSDDEEFPDLDELAHMPRPTANLESKRRMKTYSTKLQRSKLSRIQTQSSFKIRARESIRSFDAMASPPATSSPLTATHTRKSLSRATSLSSKEATPTLSVFDLGAPLDLPTPVTSALKPTQPVVHIDLDTDSDDPFAGDKDSASAPESSSDESLEIRRVSKKIRGVLPASHLRLDQSRNKTRARSWTQRDGIDISPAKPVTQRGVALPRHSATMPSPSITKDARLSFLSDESDDAENEFQSAGFIAEDDATTELDGLFDGSRLGLAEEDHGFDAMLPPRKRQAKDRALQVSKRRRIGSTSIFRKDKQSSTRQPKITGHLVDSHRLRRDHNESTRRDEHVSQKSRHSRKRETRKVAPCLSILDVCEDQSPRQLPNFIRIATRTARCRRGQGRQSPTKKFIRLANREDTEDAQIVLRDWRQGNIRPKSDHAREASSSNSRLPLQTISDNRQTQFHLLSPTMRIDEGNGKDRSGFPRRLLISKPQQQSMKIFVTVEATPFERQHPSITETVRPSKEYIQMTRPRQKAPPVRLAQLEASEVHSLRLNASSAFKSTKKTLDVLYRTSRKHHGSRSNLQLGRFLSDNDIVRPSIEKVNGIATPIVGSPAPISRPAQAPRRKMNLPQRVDVGAAKYRQPSEPLILEFQSSPSVHDEPSESHKLQGLGKFGTKYPLYFDVHPLHSGAYFHDSTFIGSGRLSEVLVGARTPQDLTGLQGSLTINDTDLQWGIWNERVSSEMGLCFDWIGDQLLLPFSQAPAVTPTTDTTTAVFFVVDYIQHRIRYIESHGQVDFLARMVEILEDFSARVEHLQSAQHKLEQWSQALVGNSVILLQLLQSCRAMPSESALVSRLERLLNTISLNCVKLLLQAGLEQLRKLYDDVQYLTFRENGIRKDQFAIHSWVVLMKILHTARIPKGSFWDVVNSLLVGVDEKHMNDARSLEKMWFSMFSLLPLFEFDEFGVIKTGRRHTIETDNWWLPQRILKKIFELYRLNPRQPPGYNDYFRTTLHRCHYLMTEWNWWKCAGIIGTVFDLFASQQLAHLRNEEAYDSPRFLRELDTIPSLSIEPEDRSFHIFLKMVGLALKHMDLGKNIKGICNLVARLLPNHDRQYPKEEDVHHRELASLRNHHDLLCLLFWAAPEAQRPSLSLLRDLVIPGQSHNEACLINLRAWEILTRFIVTSSTSPSDYQPFTAWQNASSSALSKQYLDTEGEVRHQADILAKSNQEIVSETRLQETVVSNKKSTLETLRAMVKIMEHTVVAATSSPMATQAFNPDLLFTVYSLLSGGNPIFPHGIVKDCMDVVCRYLDKIDRLQPASLENPVSEEFDSQGSLELDFNLDRVEMIHVTDYFQMPGFDVGLEWMIALTMPQSDSPHSSGMTNSLTAALQLKDYHLAVWPANLVVGTELGTITWSDNVPANHTLIRVAIDIMRSILSSQANVHLVLGNTSLREAAYRFSTILKEMMASMQSRLESMTTASDEHKAYVEYVQPIISIMRSYAGDIQPLLEFFTHPSAHYWPEDQDPNLYTAGIISYSLRLAKQPGRTSSELFHYLYNGWRKDLVHGRIGQHMNYVSKGMSRWEFSRFLLSEFMPAALHVGFHSAGGWVLCATYLPVIAAHVFKILRKKSGKSSIAYENLVNILKIISNGVTTQNSAQAFPMTHITYQFWLSVFLPLLEFAAPNPVEAANLNAIVESLLDYIRHASREEEEELEVTSKDWPRYEVQNGEHVRLGDLLGPQTLREMLEVASPYLEPKGHDPVIMPRSTSLDVPIGAAVEEDSSAPSQKARNGRTPGRIRPTRPRQPEGLPPVVLPGWFLDGNVKRAEELKLQGDLAVYGTGQSDELKLEDVGVQGVSEDVIACDLAPTATARYSMHVHVYQEILSAIRAGLALRPPTNSDDQALIRPVTHLYCPKDGGSYYLDSVVQTIASKLEADLITLDAQDIGQIVGSYIDENVAWLQSPSGLAVLSYENSSQAGKLEEFVDKEESSEQDEAEEEDLSFAGFTKNNKPPPPPPRGFPRMADLIKSYSVFLPSGQRAPAPSSGPFTGVVDIVGALTRSRGEQGAPSPDADQWKILKTTAIVNALIDAAETKAATSLNSSENVAKSDPKGSRGTIIQVRDYKTLAQTTGGVYILDQLRTAVNKRWKEGKNIVLVGTTSIEEDEQALSKVEIQELQHKNTERTIYVPPDRREEQDTVFESDEKARIRRINIRHIEDMLEKLSEGTQHLSLAVDVEKGLDSGAVYSSGLEDAVWAYSRVQRVAMTILGSRVDKSSSEIDGLDLGKALELLSSSDEAKFSWGAAELKEEDDEIALLTAESTGAAKKNETTKDKLKQIKKNCNSHEKKLLNSVVIPSDLRTTFEDIRAPKETIEALKTLTSLSLIRPEAFSYGVLATDKIPGLLLYGPPGTGKTLLAKAVAKESGATVLEISGADVNDMFVGEGEKNVKAVFSLAKKLSPCVVFIDEADAIFSSRGETRRSGAHRELINQFLREWDGMNDLSAFIMVATNRPFDLDEAVLRRLPRRLLVDLPVEKDREAILKIHLKDEILDDSISLAKLAKDTPFYSGSDLKNLSVAAALACIREENEIAAKHTGDEPHVYPEKRTLSKKHFDKALEEISASISEDMSTLAAIRKFDEKYGDRKGRRKKASALGFGGTTIVEKDSEAARVRKMDI
ncbi:Mus7/MMS22 family-domain-containing protein [Halenospora varia]|nr:Mus7/MMS22 family-domain-containing protein [Halenospora varia]